MVAGARPEVVYHLAAQIDVRRSVADPLHDARVNVLGTIALAEAALEAGCRRLVFASSGGTVYGEPDPADLPIDERYPPRVTNPYGVSKRSAEDYLASLPTCAGWSRSACGWATSTGPGRTRTARPGWWPSSATGCWPTSR